LISNPLSENNLLDQSVSSAVQARTRTTNYEENRQRQNQTTLEIEALLTKILLEFEKCAIYHSILIQFFSQMFNELDKSMFNFLIEKATLFCAAERGIRIKIVLPMLEDWLSNNLRHIGITKAVAHNMGGFPYTSQTANLLVLPNKRLLKEKGVFENLCPLLTTSHLYHFLSHFQPSATTKPVPIGVLNYVLSRGEITQEIENMLLK